MPPEPRMDALVGTVLEGAYRITRLIGEGGMGAVYEAVQLRLNKRVAIKLMARDLAANREALARFHREAEITSHLGHPHLVNVVDFGQAESGEPYLVMEYLEGEDLDHRLRRVGRMPIEAASHVVKQVASALSAAHGQGVVHRDLKPGNVFLVQIPGEPDFVKVLDFGISKMKAARKQLTNASAVMGTPNYMSPEQATGVVEEIDHHADQWALACIAWEMLLGRGPFVADDVAAILYQIINLDPHPLAPRVPGLPPAVERALRRALSKRPAERFSSMREFSRAFEAAAFGRPADATPTPVLVSPATPSGATIAYGKTPAPATPARPPAAPAPRDERKPNADLSQTIDDAIDVLPRNRIKPIHAIVAAAGVLLLLGAFLLFRSGPAPKPAPVAAPKPTPPPATIARLAPGPTVTPLPDPAPPPAAAVPEPAPLPPARGGEAKPSVARRSQPASPSAVAPASAAKSPAAESFDVDELVRDQDQRKAQALGPAFDARAKRWHDPFADHPGAPPEAKQPKKPVLPPATEPPRAPKPQSRKQPLIEEL
ncbi:MAG TPA: serine/threonine-protein kinase [Polyangia bacterium]|nr:serine/threonine-protein kinase [Polyangia bacterium]